MHSPKVKLLLPKSVPGLIIVTLGMLIIIALPVTSKFISYRYVFSWSMYNGAWIHENYSFHYEGEPSEILTRDAVLNKYKIDLLPYGLKPLQLICQKEKTLKFVQRNGEFPATYNCASNQGGFK